MRLPLPAHRQARPDAAVGIVAPNESHYPEFDSMRSPIAPVLRPRLPEDTMVNGENREHSPPLASGYPRPLLKHRRRPSSTKIKVLNYYGIAYHFLKQHWIIFTAFLLSGIVSASIAVGWSFRLKMFNIADSDSTHNAVVGSFLSIAGEDEPGFVGAIICPIS